MTYKEGFCLIGQGMWGILRMLPKTFARNTRDMVVNHPIYLMVFVGIIAYQFVTIADERVARDMDSKEMLHLQEQLDSVQMKHYTYRSY